MGMRMPETCWAVFKWQVINLRSCCIWLVDSDESMMMHGLANPKFLNWLLCLSSKHSWSNNIGRFFPAVKQLWHEANLLHPSGPEVKNEWLYLQSLICLHGVFFSDLVIFRKEYKIWKNILVYKSQQDAEVTEFILSEDCSTCFGFYYHPSLEHKTTVTTASGNRYTVRDRVKFYW